MWGAMWGATRFLTDLETRAPSQSHVLRPGRNRTYDRQIRRLLLYPLSYGGQKRAVRAVRPARASL